MKKIITLLTILILSISCNKDEKEDTNTEKDIPVTNDNVAGTWYLKQVIQPGGAYENYIHKCSSKRDYWTISRLIDIDYYLSNDCDTQIITSSCDTYLDGNKIINCSAEFEGTIIKLTNKTMIIDYGETRNNTYVDQNLDVATGLVLSRE